MPVVHQLTEQELLTALACGEEKDWEFKHAKGGLPGSIWETYSAMANTDGGCIVLGVEQRPDGFVFSGVPDVAKTKKSFWDGINNRQQVSVNFLNDDRVIVQQVQGHDVIVIRVPRATRQQRPVFIGMNPLTGTYRRNFEGDYHCTEDEVGRMLADRSDEPADSRILDGFGPADLDDASVQQYRQRFSARAPAHPWLSEEPKAFLEKLGAWRRDRNSGREGLTIAGLLMFGKDQAIRDPAALPEFHLDYRERLSADPSVRWTDRVTLDGTWVGNLFQFYQRVYPKLVADLKIPFQLNPDMFRRDDTIVHESIREATVNALVHADYRGKGGIVIEKHTDRLEMSNPGSLLVSIDQLMTGGVSECRNKSLQQMFLMIGGGEKAGSGIDKIRQGWGSQQWRWPRIMERMQPDRVKLALPMVSLLPQNSLDRLNEQFGDKFDGLTPLEVQALVTAEIEGEVSNVRLREMTKEHSSDLTRMLQGLCGKGLLLQDGSGRWTSYRLSPKIDPVKSLQIRHDSPHSPGTPHTPTSDSSRKIVESLHALSDSERQALDETAQAAVQNPRLKPEDMRRVILALCERVYLTASELGHLLQRNPNGLRDRFLRPLIEEGRMRRKYPEEPNRPDQAYAAKLEQGAA